MPEGPSIVILRELVADFTGCDIRLQYRAHLGATQRRAFFCGNCQVLYR